MKLWTDDGRTTEASHTISSPGAFGSRELKIKNKIYIIIIFFFCIFNFFSFFTFVLFYIHLLYSWRKLTLLTFMHEYANWKDPLRNRRQSVLEESRLGVFTRLNDYHADILGRAVMERLLLSQ